MPAFAKRGNARQGAMFQPHTASVNPTVLRHVAVSSACRMVHVGRLFPCSGVQRVLAGSRASWNTGRTHRTGVRSQRHRPTKHGHRSAAVRAATRPELMPSLWSTARTRAFLDVTPHLGPRQIGDAVIESLIGVD